MKNDDLLQTILESYQQAYKQGKQHREQDFRGDV